ncbi:hypothetical protein EVAR_28042_1 [Eumeta japonica]|uniref:Uncharacterized protein n=1 Tax=Eumeta variegata TaxID=151549 RepID=A0A4C1W619_EUMVA|nr:hypothetical protein EVAR_28042_1 [Eumeta japonica]
MQSPDHLSGLYELGLPIPQYRDLGIPGSRIILSRVLRDCVRDPARMQDCKETCARRPRTYASNRLRRDFKKKLKKFEIDLDEDIVAITTDGASVMVKTGSSVPAFQQLCYAHGLQLGILDVLYKKNESIRQEPIDDDILDNSEAESNDNDGRPNISENSGFTVEVVEFRKYPKPVKLAVEVLCRQDATLITAEATLKFMIKKLEDNNSALASELALCLRRRILQRRTNLNALLMYLQNPCNYCASNDDETFCLPSKNVLRKQIQEFVMRMKFGILNSPETEQWRKVFFKGQTTAKKFRHLILILLYKKSWS